ncbi:MAG: peptidase E [Actinomycetota bacterium]|nr:peptidase E [Actinomycetota bacterium]
MKEGDATVVRLPLEEDRQIVAYGGGGFSMEAGNRLLDAYVLDLARRRRERPRVCFLPTASGDADHYVVRFYRAFPGSVCEPSHISLFRRDRGARDLRAHMLAQDLVYVGGGSILSLLGTWRAHGLDAILAEAWRAGVILCGLSAGSLCWYSQGVTSFHGEVHQVRGLGLLPWSNCVHYGTGQDRRVAYHAMLRRGMCPGYAAEDGTALHFRGPKLISAIASRPQARAWCVGDRGEEIVETALPTRYLGEPQVPTRVSGGPVADDLEAVA